MASLHRGLKFGICVVTIFSAVVTLEDCFCCRLLLHHHYRGNHSCCYLDYSCYCCCCCYYYYDDDGDDDDFDSRTTGACATSTTRASLCAQEWRSLASPFRLLHSKGSRRETMRSMAHAHVHGVLGADQSGFATFVCMASLLAVPGSMTWRRISRPSLKLVVTAPVVCPSQT